MNRERPLQERRSSHAGVAHDFVILAETHTHWTSAAQIAEERGWIRTHGQWISERALEGDAQLGQGFVYLPWQIDDASERRRTARFRSLRDYVDTANMPHSFLGRFFDQIDCEFWAEVIAQYDPDISMVVFVESEGPNMPSGISHYFVVKPGAALLMPWE